MKESFMASYRRMSLDLLSEPPFNAGQWQGMDVSKSRAHWTHEMEDVTCVRDNIPISLGSLMSEIPADLPWAEEHFLERVSGMPLNPAPSHVRWPYAVRGNGDHTDAGVFDHTYPERFWPVMANVGETAPNGRQIFVPHMGIRFAYGDLMDVVDLLQTHRLTRQAYLPVWFPEDTGGSNREKGRRVPCTLGYHFMVRDGRLSVRYFIRSCDLYRHFINDVYMACRLAQWICDTINEREEQKPDDEPIPESLYPGKLIMHISSLHLFVGDVDKLKKRINV